jgi:hypothetical protein
MLAVVVVAHIVLHLEVLVLVAVVMLYIQQDRLG